MASSLDFLPAIKPKTSLYTDLNISVWQMEIKISRGYVYPTTFLYLSK